MSEHRVPASNVVVRRVEHGDGGQMLELSRQGFSDYSGGVLLDPSHEFFVAEQSCELVGFGGMTLTRPTPTLRGLLNYLDPTVRRMFEPLDGVAPPVSVEAPEGYATAQERGVYLTALTVASSHRRRGIGKRLVRARLDLAVRQGARQAWVNSVVGSGSRELYEGVGFTALVTLTTFYPKGQGMTLLHADQEVLENLVG